MGAIGSVEKPHVRFDVDAKSGSSTYLKQQSNEQKVNTDPQNMAEGSQAVRTKRTHQVTSEMDKRIIEALIAKKKRKMNVKHTLKRRPSADINKVVLNFPRILETFKHIRFLYEQADANKDGSLSLDEVKGLMVKLCRDVNMNELEQLFRESDITEDGILEFKEFIGLIALANMLDIFPELSQAEETNVSQQISSNNIKRSFDLATDMYLAFDEDCTGTICYAEVAKILAERSSSGLPDENSGFFSSDLVKDHWKSLDWDNDGFITYKEFINTFAAWVNDIAPDEDDEEEE